MLPNSAGRSLLWREAMAGIAFQRSVNLNFNNNTTCLSLTFPIVVLPHTYLSAAFDTIDHSILLSYLKSWFGLGGNVLKCFASYLGDRCQFVKIGSTLSELSKLIYSVPQGSVLGPLLFSLYTTPLSKIIHLHPHIKFHFYADDTQLYIHLSHKNASAALARLNACLLDVQRWMSLSKLKLNPEKTEFIVFGSKSQRLLRSFPPTFLLVSLAALFIRLILLEI